ncbi:MAG: hypothetical protein UR26_C0003G0028 [candidate division TM6 bacterium GW2011_GWF2_32_72]|nr:MAG: hypothetical protein UR26_C0003G0028 [candidate division TM6 bacterium GW2011_GWF2_32_72]
MKERRKVGGIMIKRLKVKLFLLIFVVSGFYNSHSRIINFMDPFPETVVKKLNRRLIELNSGLWKVRHLENSMLAKNWVVEEVIDVCYLVTKIKRSKSPVFSDELEFFLDSLQKLEELILTVHFLNPYEIASLSFCVKFVAYELDSLLDNEFT